MPASSGGWKNRPGTPSFCQPSNVLGAALILPAGLLAQLQGQPIPEASLFASQKKAVEEAATQAVMAKEHTPGYLPVDVHRDNLGWDIESAIPNSGKLRFIEVKGRVEGAETITVSKNEILAGLNKPESFLLAVVEIGFELEQAKASNVHYIQRPFRREPDFAAASVNYNWKELERFAGDR